MTPCPSPNCGGTLWTDEDGLHCMLCGYPRVQQDNRTIVPKQPRHISRLHRWSPRQDLAAGYLLVTEASRLLGLSRYRTDAVFRQFSIPTMKLGNHNHIVERARLVACGLLTAS